MNIKFLKKVTFLLLLSSSFLINAQNGNSCEDAVYINNQNIDTIVNYNMSTTNKWINFTAITNTITFNVFCYSKEISIILYSGDCNNMQEVIRTNDFNIYSDSLNIGQNYFIKLETDTVGVELITKFSRQPVNPEELAVCGSFASCNKIFNNDYQLGNFDFVGGVDADAFTSDVSGWSSFNTAALIESGTEHIARLGTYTSSCS